MTFATPDVLTNINLENNDNVTHMLVASFTGSVGDELDTNDDCVMDVYAPPSAPAQRKPPFARAPPTIQCALAPR